MIDPTNPAYLSTAMSVTSATVAIAQFLGLVIFITGWYGIWAASNSQSFDQKSLYMRRAITGIIFGALLMSFDTFVSTAVETITGESSGFNSLNVDGNVKSGMGILMNTTSGKNGWSDVIADDTTKMIFVGLYVVGIMTIVRGMLVLRIAAGGGPGHTHALFVRGIVFIISGTILAHFPKFLGFLYENLLM